MLLRRSRFARAVNTVILRTLLVLKKKNIYRASSSCYNADCCSLHSFKCAFMLRACKLCILCTTNLFKYLKTDSYLSQNRVIMCNKVISDGVAEQIKTSVNKSIGFISI